VKAYGTLTQLHAAFEIYRAFPANEKFNAAQRERNDVLLFVAGGDGSSFANLLPKIAEGLRANGCTHVETGLIPDSIMSSGIIRMRQPTWLNNMHHLRNSSAFARDPRLTGSAKAEQKLFGSRAMNWNSSPLAT
jgi:hypothetical protein